MDSANLTSDILHVFDTNGCWEVLPSLRSCPKSCEIVSAHWGATCLPPSARSLTLTSCRVCHLLPPRHTWRRCYHFLQPPLSRFRHLRYSPARPEITDTKFSFSSPPVAVRAAVILMWLHAAPLLAATAQVFLTQTHFWCISSSHKICFWDKLIAINVARHFSQVLLYLCVYSWLVWVQCSWDKILLAIRFCFIHEILIISYYWKLQ